MNRSDKPVIRVGTNSHTPSKVIGRVPDKFLKGNQFSLTVLSCWLNFLDKPQTP